MANFKMLLCVSIFQCDICVLYLSILLLMAFGWVTIQIYKMIPDCFSKYLYHFITLLTTCKMATLHAFSWTLNIGYFLFFFFFVGLLSYFSIEQMSNEISWPWFPISWLLLRPSISSYVISCKCFCFCENAC